MIKYFFIALFAWGLSSCVSTLPLYNWEGYDAGIYTYLHTKDEKSLETLLKTYEKLIHKTGSRKAPAPGICADCGYLLIQAGEKEKGIALLKKEKAYYPESGKLIDGILKRVEK